MKGSSAPRHRHAFLWLVAGLLGLLAVLRSAQYVAIWQTDSGGAALGQIRADAGGIFWVLVFLTLATATLLVAGQLGYKTLRFLRKTRGLDERNAHRAPTK